MLNEDFLKYVWRHRYFTTLNLKTVCGKNLHIEHPGLENHTDGPDFSYSKILLDNVQWVGNAELHVKASDWFRHKHQHDKAYNNVVLHVVYEADSELEIKGNPIPTLELKNYIPENLYLKYKNLQASKDKVPCSGLHSEVGSMVKSAFLERVFVSRIEEKVERIHQDYIQNKLSLSQVFYKWIGQTLGQKNNLFGFEQLCQNLPIEILLKHQTNIADVEAMLFGVAGFLSETNDAYSEDLKKRFSHFKNLYKLNTLDKTIWNFKGVRPNAFPTIRIAFMAAFIRQWTAVFQAGLNIASVAEPLAYTKLQASSYWDTHYTFSKQSKIQKKQAGKGLRQSILLNCLLPFYYFYSKRTGAGNYEYIEQIFTNLPVEDNTITRTMQRSGFSIKNAKEAQTMIGLYKHYCSPKKCLRCGIGHALLR